MMGAPQIIVLAMLSIGIGMHLAKDGEPRNDRYSFASSFFAGVLLVALLWWGGFFS